MSGYGAQLMLRSGIVKVADCETQNFQFAIRSKRAANLEFTALSVIIFIHGQQPSII